MTPTSDQPEVMQVITWLRDHGFRVEYNSQLHCLIVRLPEETRPFPKRSLATAASPVGPTSLTSSSKPPPSGGGHDRKTSPR